MSPKTNRRQFIQKTAALTLAATTPQFITHAAHHENKRDFKISLAGWSLHRAIRQDKTPMLDMPKVTRDEFDIDAIELVNQLLASDKKDYLDKLAKNAADHNIEILLIMIDRQGDIGANDEAERADAVKKHKHWIDIAADFGCHAVRMNWAGAPQDFKENPDAIQACIKYSAPSFRDLCDYGDKKNISVSIENHWGPSSYPDILTKLIKEIDHPRMGTLPDFGNFPDDVDKYHAVDAMMPYAKAVSAKCYDFDPETGEDTKIDFNRMLEIVHDKHNYNGYIGIEYEGNKLGEFDGIKAAKKLLEKHRKG